MGELKQREQDILAYIRKKINEDGFPPTVRDICADLKIKSTSTVQKSMEILESEGYIRKKASKRHVYDVVDKEEQGKIKAGECAVGESEVIPYGSKVERADVVDVPLVGRVAAGTPITAEENIESYYPMPANLAKGNSFMLEVHGESMIEAGILDGDYILVQEQKTANNGDMVVAMIEGEYESEATVKTFYKENGHIRLQPHNSSMKPIIVDNCQIVGLVKGVFRYLN